MQKLSTPKSVENASFSRRGFLAVSALATLAAGHIDQAAADGAHEIRWMVDLWRELDEEAKRIEALNDAILRRSDRPEEPEVRLSEVTDKWCAPRFDPTFSSIIDFQKFIDEASRYLNAGAEWHAQYVADLAETRDLLADRIRKCDAWFADLGFETNVQAIISLYSRASDVARAIAAHPCRSLTDVTCKIDFLSERAELLEDVTLLRATLQSIRNFAGDASPNGNHHGWGAEAGAA